MKTKTQQEVPAYLAQAGREFYIRVVEDFELEPASLALLASAAKQLDRMAEAREVLTREPVVVNDRFGHPRIHPAVEIERSGAVAFARLLRELSLDLEPPADTRPPRRPGT